MRAPSSEVEADQVAAELAKMPRTREVADRLQALIDAGTTTKDQKLRFECLLIAIDHDLSTGHELSEAEHAEWMCLLTVTKDAVPA